ncbi:alpha-scruin [Caerostris extrusa]|uniref:Alpha-scruin n=1 Tax=Caerostris extrusa TaxID=172846 RepID=A0AAV4VK68_CAEEX|nr:alpha-scruin [Caerostris extrusa]
MISTTERTTDILKALPCPAQSPDTAATALAIDYIATSDPKWNIDNINESAMNEAAVKIQSVFRGYRTRSLLSSNKFPLHSSHSDMAQRRSIAPLSESYHDKWKLFQRVQIDDWPPIPDPRNLPSELDVRLGTLPKGYTVSAVNTNGRTKIRRYVPLPEHVDPNLGIKILGLRKVEHLPTFARDMFTVTSLQDDSFPVVLVMGGLQTKRTS